MTWAETVMDLYRQVKELKSFLASERLINENLKSTIEGHRSEILAHKDTIECLRSTTERLRSTIERIQETKN